MLAHSLRMRAAPGIRPAPSPRHGPREITHLDSGPDSDTGGTHGLGFLDRARVPAAAGLDARIRARGDLADRDDLRPARRRRVPAADRAAAGAGARARPVGGAPGPR